MEVARLDAVGDDEGLLTDLRLGQLDEVEEPLESDVPRGVRPHALVALVELRIEVEERIPPRAAEGDERVLDGGFDLATNKTGDLKRLMEFVELEKRGFDQTPCGTNWVGWVRKAHKVDADDVIGKLVRFARENIAPERLKGFMMASWAACDTRENVDFLKRGVDLFAASQC